MAEVLSATKQFKRLFQGTLDPTMSWDSEEELREYLKDPTCPKNMVVAANGNGYIVYETSSGTLDLKQLGTLEDTQLGQVVQELKTIKYDDVLIKQQQSSDGTITPYLEFYANGVLMKTIEVGGSGLNTSQLDNIEKIPNIEKNAQDAYDTSTTTAHALLEYSETTDETLRLKANISYVDSIKEDHETRMTSTESNVEYLMGIVDELTYKSIATTKYTITQSTAEIGSNIARLQLNWDYNKPPTSQSLNGESLDVDVRTKNFDNVKSNTTYTLTASDGKSNLSKSLSITFLNGKYYGSKEVSSYDSNFIQSLTKVLTNGRTGTFTTTCGQGQYIFFAIPTRFGTPSFTVGGFTGGFAKVDTIDYTNPSGYVESYDIYKSDYSNLGNTTVVVG